MPHCILARRRSPALAALLFLMGAALAGSAPGAAAAPGSQWIPFAGGAAPAAPALALTSADRGADGAIDLRADVPGVYAAPQQAGGGTFTRLSGEGFVSATQYGLPDLPVLRRDVEIPFGAEARLELVSSESRELALEDLGLPGAIAPLQPSQCKCRDAQPFSQDAAAYRRDAVTPDTPIAVRGEYVVRGHRVLTVEVWPVAYNAARGTLRVFSRVDVRIRLRGGDLALTRARAEHYASPAFESALAGRILNFNQGRAPRDFTRDPSPAGYLIISADAYAAAMAPFVVLKQSEGYQVTSARLSDIPGGTHDAIRAYVENAYHTWSPPPSYVLLVGDVDNGPDTLPAWIGPDSESTTDLYYATMDGPDDWVPDIHRGRLPARTPAQAAAMVQKSLAYAAATGAEPWARQAAWAATCDQYLIAEGTHNYVIDTYTAGLGYTGGFPLPDTPGGDRLYCITHGATGADITTAVNGGRALVIYSGHGGLGGWEMGFDQNSVRALDSNHVYPFVAGHGCVSGDFGQTEVFGETWVIQPDKGALAFYGSSAGSYWNEDDVLERRYFDALFNPAGAEPSLSEMSYAGLAGVQNAYPESARHYWETYNILGDPGVKILLGPRPPDFYIGATPDHLQLCSAGQVTATLLAGSVAGYSGTVTLSAPGLPAGISAAFEPAQLAPPGSARLTVADDGSAAAGRHEISVAAGGAGRAHTITVALDVSSAAPAVPVLLAPPNGAPDRPLRPVFSWSPAAQAVSYDLQIATDSRFTQIVVEVGGLVSTTYALPSELASNVRYYWRIAARNGCGSGSYSQHFTFVTIAAIGQCTLGSDPLILYQDDLEGSAAGWTSGGISNTWALSSARAHSGRYAFRAADLETASDQRLVSPAVVLPEGTVPLYAQFWNYQDIEANTGNGCFDGSILEISTDAGSTWTQLDAQLLGDPYDGEIPTGFGNPLGGRRAWCGSPQDWNKTVADLSAYAGRTVSLRFRLGSDWSTGREGWYVDDVDVHTCRAQANQVYLPAVVR